MIEKCHHTLRLLPSQQLVAKNVVRCHRIGCVGRWCAGDDRCARGGGGVRSEKQGLKPGDGSYNPPVAVISKSNTYS